MIRWPLILFAAWQASQLILGAHLAGPLMRTVLERLP